MVPSQYMTLYTVGRAVFSGQGFLEVLAFCAALTMSGVRGSVLSSLFDAVRAPACEKQFQLYSASSTSLGIEHLELVCYIMAVVKNLPVVGRQCSEPGRNGQESVGLLVGKSSLCSNLLVF